MQYKIPQNVDVEDKIFGPLSLRQFTWLVIGGFLVTVLYLTLAKVNFALFLVAALPVAALFGALTFYRINERPFELFITSSLSSLLRPRRRIWLRIPEPENATIQPAPALSPALAPKPGLSAVRSRLEELTMIVDTQGWGRPTESTQAFTEARIVSAPAQPATQPDPEPDDPVEAPKGDLDKALEEAGRAAVARLKGRSARVRTLTPDDPSRAAYREEVLHQEVVPPVGRFASPEEMRSAIKSYQGGA